MDIVKKNIGRDVSYGCSWWWWACETGRFLICSLHSFQSIIRVKAVHGSLTFPPLNQHWSQRVFTEWYRDFLKTRSPEGCKRNLGCAAGKGMEGAEMCVVKTITKPGSRLICFCHSFVQKKSAHNLSYNNNITRVLHTFLWIGGMFTK